MANTVDERIVEARFDSSQFEKGVKKTVDKLDELKEALNLKNAGKTIAEVSKDTSSNLEKVGNTLDKLTQRLTTFTGMIKQQILGGLAQEVSNVVLSIERSIMGLVNELGGQQMHAGMQKYTDLLTSVRTLTVGGIGQEMAYKQIERLQDYSDQTNASLEAMTGLMTQIKTSGASLDTARKMVEGFSNAAYSMGVNMANLPNLYMNFAQAYGKGSMKLEDWKTFQSFNMIGEDFRDKILEAAVAVGTLNRTGDGLYQTSNKVNKAVKSSKKFAAKDWEQYISTGFFDKQVMERVFGQLYYFDQIKEEELDTIRGLTDEQRKAYFEEHGLDEWSYKAFLAGQEARSLTDAMNTLKNAISTGWKKTFELIFGKLDKATDFFTWLSDNKLVQAIRAIGDFRNAVLTAWGADFGEGGIALRGQNGREQLYKALKNIDEMIGTIHEGLGQLGVVEWNNTLGRYLTFPETIGKKLILLSRDFKIFTKKAKTHVKNFVDDFVALYTEEKNVNGETQRVLKPEYVQRMAKIKEGLSSILSIFSKLSGILLNTASRLFFKLQPIFDAVGDAIGKFIQPIIDLKNNTYVFDNIQHAINNLLKVIDPFIEPAAAFVSFLGDVAAFFLEGSIGAITLNIELLADALGLIIELFGGTSSQKAKEGVGVIEGWKKKVKEFGDTCKEAFGTIKEFFTSLFEDIRKLFGINNEANQNGNIFENVAKFFETNKFLKKVKAWINQAIKDIGAWILDIPNKISKFFVNVGDFFHGLFYTKDDAGNEIETPLKKWLNQAIINIKEWFKDLPGKIAKALNSVGDFASKLWKSIDEMLFGKKTTKLKYNKDTKKFEPYTVRVKEGLSLWLDNLWVSVKDWVKTIPDKFSKIWTAIIDFLFGKEQVKTVTDPNTGETKQITERVKQGFSKWLDDTVQNVKTFISGLPGKIVELWNTVIGWIFGTDSSDISISESGGEGDSKTQKVQKGILDWLKNTADWISTNILDPAWDFIVQIWEGVMRSIFGDVVVDVPDDAQSEGQTDSVREGLVGWLNNVLSYITGPFLETFMNIIGQIWNALIGLIFGDSVAVEDPENTGAAEDDNKVATVKTGISEWLGNLVETVKGFFADLGWAITNIWNNIINAIFGNDVETSEPTNTDAGESDTKVSTVSSGVSAWIENLSNNVSRLLVGAVDFIKAIWQGVIDGLFGTSVGSITPANTAASDSDTKTTSVKTGITNWISNIRFKVADFVKDAIDFIKKIWSTVINSIFGWDDNVDKKDTEVQGKQEKDVRTGVISWIEGLASKVGDWIRQVPGAIKNIWNTIIGAIFGSNGNVEKDIKKFSEEEYAALKEADPTGYAAEMYKRSFKENEIVSAAQSFVERIGEDIGKIISTLPTEIVKGINFTFGLADDLFTGIKDWFDRANTERAKGELEENIGNITDDLDLKEKDQTGFVSAVSELGTSIWNIITKTIPGVVLSAWDFVKGEAPKWWEKLSSAFDNVDTASIQSKITGIGNTIAGFIESLPGNITTAVETIKDLTSPKSEEIFDEEGYNEAFKYVEKQIKDTNVGAPVKEIIKKTEAAKEELKKAFTTTKTNDMFGDMTKSLGGALKNAFVEIGPYILEGLEKAFGLLESGFNFVTDVLENKEGREGSFGERLTKAIAGEDENGENTRLGQAIINLGNRIKSLFVTTIPQFLSSAADEISKQAPKILGGLFDWIGNGILGGEEGSEEATKEAEKVTENYKVALAGMTTNMEGMSVNATNASESISAGMSELGAALNDGFSGLNNVLNKINDSSAAKLAMIALIIWSISKLADNLMTLDDIGYSAKWVAVQEMVTGLLAIVGYMIYLSATGDEAQLEKVKGLMAELLQVFRAVGDFLALLSVLTIIKNVTSATKLSGFWGWIGSIIGAPLKVFGITAAASASADMAGAGIENLSDHLAVAAAYAETGADSIVQTVIDLAEALPKIGDAHEAVSKIKEIMDEFKALFSNYKRIEDPNSPNGWILVETTENIEDEFKTIGLAITRLSGSIANFKTAVTTNKLKGDVTTGVTDALEKVLDLKTKMSEFAKFVKDEDFEDFKYGLMALGSALDFYEFGNIKTLNAGIDENTVQNAVDLITRIFGNEQLNELLNAFSGEKIKDSKEIIRDAESVAIFAGGLSSIAKSCESINDETGAKIQTLFDIVSKIKVSSNSSDGITTLSQQFGEIGNALSTFAYDVSSLTEEDVKHAGDAITILTDMAVRLGAAPDDSWFAKVITGDKSIGAFAVDVSTFGEKLKDFFNTLQKTDYDFDRSKTDQISLMINQLTHMAMKLGNLDNVSIFGSKFDGLSNAGHEIVAFFNEINAFKDSGFDFEFINSVIDSFDKTTQLLYDAGAGLSGAISNVFGARFSNSLKTDIVKAATKGGNMDNLGITKEMWGIWDWNESEIFNESYVTYLNKLPEWIQQISGILLGDDKNPGVIGYIQEFYTKLDAVIKDDSYTPEQMIKIRTIIDTYSNLVTIASELYKITDNKWYDLTWANKNNEDPLTPFTTILRGINSSFDTISTLIGQIDTFDQNQLDKVLTFTSAFSAFSEGLASLTIAASRYDGIFYLDDALDALSKLNWDVAAEIKDKMYELFGGSNFYDAAKDAGESLYNGFTEGMKAEVLKQKVDDIGDLIKKELTASLSTSATDLSIWGSAYLVGEKISDGIVAGINLLYGEGVHEKPYDVVKAITDSITTLLTEINPDTSNSKFYDTGYSAGKNLGAGLEAGIKLGQVGAVEAAQNLCDAISGTFTVSWNMNSPSRLFQSFGQYLDLGLMKGIEENSDSPVNAATAMAEDSVSNVQSVLKTIQNLALDDMDITPTITPVVDMSNVTAAAQQIQALGFSSGSPFYFDTSRINYNAQTANPDYNREVKVDTDYSGIISSIRSEIAALAGTMSGVSGSLSGMRVVLDSGAIVGGIINDVDSALGRRGFYAGREG